MSIIIIIVKYNKLPDVCFFVSSSTPNKQLGTKLSQSRKLVPQYIVCNLLVHLKNKYTVLYGWMDGYMDGWIIDGYGGWGGQVGGQAGSQTGRWTDCWMDRWMDVLITSYLGLNPLPHNPDF